MSTQFNWVIQWMQCKPTEGQYTDVVVTAGWQCNGVQVVNGVSIPANTFGSCQFPMPEGQFTPYDQLTQEQVLGWCWSNGVNKAAQEADVQAQIDAKANPPTISLPLPWPPTA